MMIIIIIITIGFTGVKRAEEGEEGEGAAMPSSASAGAAPERRGRASPGAPRSGCAPSPARPVGFFGLQRLWQDGDAEHKSCSQTAPHSPAPHQVAGGAESRRPPRPAAPRTPSRTHPQHRAASLTPTACASPSPPQSPLSAALIPPASPFTGARHKPCAAPMSPPDRTPTYSPAPSPVLPPLPRSDHGFIPVKPAGCAAPSREAPSPAITARKPTHNPIAGRAPCPGQHTSVPSACHRTPNPE